MLVIISVIIFGHKTSRMRHVRDKSHDIHIYITSGVLLGYSTYDNLEGKMSSPLTPCSSFTTSPRVGSPSDRLESPHCTMVYRIVRRYVHVPNNRKILLGSHYYCPTLWRRLWGQTRPTTLPARRSATKVVAVVERVRPNRSKRRQ